MLEKHPAPVRGSEGDVLGRRMAAFVLDLVVFWASFAVLAEVGTWFEAFGLAVSSLAFLALVAYAVFYWFLMEGVYGRTPGKAYMDLVVVSEDGSPCTVGKSILRNACWVVDGFGVFPLMPVVIVFLTDRHQRVGDVVASTVVVAAQEDHASDVVGTDDATDRSASRSGDDGTGAVRVGDDAARK